MAEDPMADFLARERQALGKDAELFQNPSDFDSFSSPPPATTSEPNYTGAGASASPLAEDQSQQASGLGFNEHEMSMQSFNALSSAGSPTSSHQQYSHFSPSISDKQTPNLEDGGFIEEWREKQQAIIAERDEGARKRHDETVEKARQEIDKFYDEYNEKRDKRVQENRANQEIELQQATTGNVWERTLRQIDIVSKSVSSTQAAEVKSVRSPPASSRSGQTQSPFSLEARGGAFGSRARESVEAGSSIQIRDTTRMRELLQDLKKDPKAPGIEAKS